MFRLLFTGICCGFGAKAYSSGSTLTSSLSVLLDQHPFLMNALGSTSIAHGSKHKHLFEPLDDADGEESLLEWTVHTSSAFREEQQQQLTSLLFPAAHAAEESEGSQSKTFAEKLREGGTLKNADGTAAKDSYVPNPNKVIASEAEKEAREYRKKQIEEAKKAGKSIGGKELHWDKSPEFQMELQAKGISLEEYDQQRREDQRERKPVKLVVVGGGYAGSKLTFNIDSLFDLTLIDEKNFVELSSDIVPILCNKWEDEKSEEAVLKLTALHRFYIKQANILTGRVVHVGENEVTLGDGRKVEFDALVLATGRKKPFPWRTQQRTIKGRIEELKHFNKFLLGKCHKIAVVGGGPLGITLADHLSQLHPEKDISLFHAHSMLTPSLGSTLSNYTQDHLEKMCGHNLKIHYNTYVKDIQASASAPVTYFQEENPLMLPFPTEESTKRPWWKFWGGSTSSLKVVGKDVTKSCPTKYTVVADICGATERLEKKSMLYLAYIGDPNSHLKDRSREVLGEQKFEGFDYVFDLTGFHPDPIRNSELLEKHVDLDGYYRVSTLMMLLGHPNIFAVGSCNSFPWTKSFLDSDTQIRIMFKNLFKIVNQMGASLESKDGVSPDGSRTPRMSIKFANMDGMASTAWGGSAMGYSACKEYFDDRGYLLKEFKTPKFFKRQSVAKVRDNWDAYLERQVTDVTDFDY